MDIYCFSINVLLNSIERIWLIEPSNVQRLSNKKWQSDFVGGIIKFTVN